MWNIPDAPWVQNPEYYADEYYGKPIYTDDEDEDSATKNDTDE